MTVVRSGDSEMRVVITGARGQLGRSLQKGLKRQHLLLIDLPEYDVTEPSVIDVIESFDTRAS